MSEKQNTECKQNWKDEWLKWISGFANTQGGKLYIGLDDNGNPTGQLANLKKLMEDIPNKEDFESYAKLSIAVNLYKSGNVSLGYCTAFAGIEKRDFIKELGKRNISVFNFESEEDFVEDVSNA